VVGIYIRCASFLRRLAVQIRPRQGENQSATRQSNTTEATATSTKTEPARTTVDVASARSLLRQHVDCPPNCRPRETAAIRLSVCVAFPATPRKRPHPRTFAKSSARVTDMSDAHAQDAPAKGRRKGKKDGANDDGSKKRRCISSACVPCRKRKSKVLPAEP
jgi:hypothetical protein